MPMKPDLESILKLEVPIIVRIAERQVTVDEVVSWVPGMILDMATHADDELHLLVNNIAIGTGTAVKIGENFGIRISFVGDLRSRIEALAAVESEEGANAPLNAEATRQAEAARQAEERREAEEVRAE